MPLPTSEKLLRICLTYIDMIKLLDINVDQRLFESLIEEIPTVDFKLTLNQPKGDFFYDPWEISDRFRGTAWDEILKTLNCPIGEARVISLSKKECYMAHADIDNRWHLPIITGKSFLVDLDTKTLHKLTPGNWYYMDAGRDHSAVNFGETDRIQLVVRELLKRGTLLNPKKVVIKPVKELPNIRYLFDNVYSPWLNTLNVNGLMDNFVINGNTASLDIESQVDVPQHEAFEVC